MTMTKIRKTLIANRGEIAARITQTLQQRGIAVVAVYAPEDAALPHVRLADEAYPLAGDTVQETYLNTAQLLAIAQQAGADSLHPGYGFLSENAAFAEVCQAAGLLFIGPSPRAMRLMGDKVAARATMEAAGVPVLPGWSGSLPNDSAAAEACLREAAQQVGYPLLIKAAAGGGGKGMRHVAQPDALASALESAAREAGQAFGDTRVFLERYLVAPRHIEVQILADHHGQVLSLPERDCSIQRRHQKVLETTPALHLPDAVRENMRATATQVGQACGYTNAGTVEFLYDVHTQAFYFLEMNTRLQVEHPITECVTGLDLVALQIDIAEGQPLALPASALEARGCAMEVRLYAEDPDRQFFPSGGRIAHFQPATGPGIRWDVGLEVGQAISTQFDPLLAKLIVSGPSHAACMARMAWALDHTQLLGADTNLPFLQWLSHHPDVLAGQTHTQWLETCLRETGPQGLQFAAMPAALPDALLAEVRAWAQQQAAAAATHAGASQETPRHWDPWQQAG
jgi:acetyl/propionyl-CoA carboxylase alpha subunit